MTNYILIDGSYFIFYRVFALHIWWRNAKPEIKLENPFQNEEFVEKYKDKTDGTNIIGHFGLGFYSSFMVADKVEVETLSMTKDAVATKWVCEGDTDYEFSASDKRH